MRLLRYVLIASTLFSCIKEISFDTEIKSKIVINAIFSTDSLLKVRLSTSSPITETYDGGLSKLNMTILENKKVIFDSIVNFGTTITDFFPVANVQYEISIESLKYSAVYASDSIPLKVRIVEADLFFPTNIDEYGSYWGEAEISFNDPLEETNYYEILLFSDDKYYMNNYYDSPMLDPVILNEGDLDYYQTSLFFSDELFNGKTYVMRIKVTMGVTINNDEIKPIGAYYAELRSVSKNYYLYRKYYTRHTHNQQQQDKDFNDFVYMGEPINMYSNIENGYGVFAGYQSSVMQLKLKN